MAMRYCSGGAACGHPSAVVHTACGMVNKANQEGVQLLRVFLGTPVRITPEESHKTSV